MAVSRRWRTQREAWQKKKGDIRAAPKYTGVALDYNDFSEFARVYRRYPKPIPLSELVDFVHDSWLSNGTS